MSRSSMFWCVGMGAVLLGLFCACSGTNVPSSAPISADSAAGLATGTEAPAQNVFFDRIVNGANAAGCSLGFSGCCTALGMRYESGRGVEQSYWEAARFYLRGCRRAKGEPCQALRDLNERLVALKVKSVDSQAKYDQQCGGIPRDEQTCAEKQRELNRLSAARKAGESVDVSRLLCESGVVAACTRLGLSFENAWWGRQDFGEAMRFYRDACKKGDGHGCSRVGFLYDAAYGVWRNPQEALTYYQKGCDSGDVVGCANLEAAKEHPPLSNEDVRAEIRRIADRFCGGKPDRCCELIPLYEGERLGPLNAFCNTDVTLDSVYRSRMPSSRLAHQKVHADIDCIVNGTCVLGSRGAGEENTENGPQKNVEAGASETVPTDPCLKRSDADTKEVIDGATSALIESDCQQDNSNCCRKLGDLYANGSLSKPNIDELVYLFKTQCEKGRGGSCTALGALYAKGVSVKADVAEAARQFIKGCERHDGDACGRLGVLCMEHKDFLAPLSAAWQISKARYDQGLESESGVLANLTEVACKQGEAEACAVEGTLYLGNHHFPRQDYPKAEELLAHACKAGNPLGCANLGGLYFDGLSVGHDANEAIQLTRIGCDGGDAFGCYKLGTAYEKGLGSKRNVAEAARLYEKTGQIVRKECENGKMQGCYRLGVLHAVGHQGVAQDFAEAGRLWEQACQRHYAPACGQLGILYTNGPFEMRDAEKARRSFEEGCDGNNALSCRNLGVVSQNDSTDTREVCNIYKTACELDPSGEKSSSCAWLQKSPCKELL